MKECLNCKNQYQEKRSTSRFCSNKCRSAFHRGGIKSKKKVDEDKLSSMFNAILGAINSINARNGQPEAIAAVFRSESPVQVKSSAQQQPVAPEVLMRRYIEERRDCTCEEEFISWFERLESDQRLSTRQKQMIKNTN